MRGKKGQGRKRHENSWREKDEIHKEKKERVKGVKKSKRSKERKQTHWATTWEAANDLPKRGERTQPSPPRDEVKKTQVYPHDWDLVRILVSTQNFRQIHIYIQIQQICMEYLVVMPLERKTQGFLNIFSHSAIFVFHQEYKTKVLADFTHPHNDPRRNMKLIIVHLFWRHAGTCMENKRSYPINKTPNVECIALSTR